MNFLMIAIFFQWQLWKYEAEHQERVVRLSLPGPAPHIQVIPPCLTQFIGQLSLMVPQVFSASGKDHEEGGERCVGWSRAGGRVQLRSDHGGQVAKVKPNQKLSK